jgi:biopolymer transport protein ExbD|tara:strand:- start:50 stop:529 length:480 start_codon:yes stop_codon:yes gene_type:complete
VKAKLSLPERPSALYLLAVLDVLAVLLIFFALIPLVDQQAGAASARIEISSRVPSVDAKKKVILNVKAGAQVIYRLEGKTIELRRLREELGRIKEERGIEVVVAVTDENMKAGVMFQIEEIAVEAGLDVHFVGRFPLEQAGFRNLKSPPPRAEVVEPER